MSFNAGIVTPKFAETRAFYIDRLGFRLVFENEFFFLLEGYGDQISFLRPRDPGQASIFQPEFGGRGVYLTVEVDDVDAEYAKLRAKGVAIEVELRNEPWGERHFAVVDPNGIGIDFVKYVGPDAGDG